MRRPGVSRIDLSVFLHKIPNVLLSATDICSSYFNFVNSMPSESNKTSKKVEKYKGDLPQLINNAMSFLVLPKNFTSSTKPRLVRLKLDPVSASKLATSNGACRPRGNSGYWTSCSESENCKCEHIETSSDLDNCSKSVVETTCATGTTTEDCSESGIIGSLCTSSKCKCCSCTSWVDIDVPLKKDVSLSDCLTKQTNKSKKCRKVKKCKQPKKMCGKSKCQLVFQIIYYGFVIPFLICFVIWVSNKSTQNRNYRIFY